MKYLHRDHLGSVDTITDAAGAVLERLSYDAFGKRRIAAGENAWTDPALAISAVNTPRGFTGHEHLDAFQLVHMNGRVQDPHLGRFISADPFVQFPESTQGLNRYSYVANNPLSFTDPSGYFLGFLLRPFRKIFQKILSVPIFRTIANIANVILSAQCGPAAPACLAAGSAAITAAAGGDIGDMLKAAAIAYVSAEAFNYIGHGMPLPDDPGLRYLAKTAAHGVVGGVRSVASGGEFGPGFLSAGFTQAASPAIGTIGAEGSAGTPARVIAAAVVGGTASRLGGGKFANGAVTGSFLWMYNHGAKNRSRARTARSRVEVTWSVNEATGEHYYRIRGAICSAGPGCESAYADSVYDYVNAGDVPFSGDDLGGGQRGLMFGTQPIRHYEFPDIRQSINATVDGHMFHPGSVTHHVHFEAGTLHYDVIGQGTGAWPRINVFIGRMTFRPQVYRAVRRFGQW